MNIKDLQASIEAEGDRHNAALVSIAEDVLERQIRPFCASRGWGFGAINNDWWFTECHAKTHEQRFRKAGDLPDDFEFESVCALLSVSTGHGQDIGCFLHGTRISETT